MTSDLTQEILNTINSKIKREYKLNQVYGIKRNFYRDEEWIKIVVYIIDSKGRSKYICEEFVFENGFNITIRKGIDRNPKYLFKERSDVEKDFYFDNMHFIDSKIHFEMNYDEYTNSHFNMEVFLNE